MPWYRKKPQVIEAHQLGAEGDLGAVDLVRWVNDRGGIAELVVHADSHVAIDLHTLEGVMTASPGDFVIRGVAGEFYPCKPDIFERTYTKESSPE